MICKKPSRESGSFLWNQGFMLYPPLCQKYRGTCFFSLTLRCPEILFGIHQFCVRRQFALDTKGSLHIQDFLRTGDTIRAARSPSCRPGLALMNSGLEDMRIEVATSSRRKISRTELRAQQRRKIAKMGRCCCPISRPIPIP